MKRLRFLSHFSATTLRGFSLAEVLIAIVIIAILTIGSITAFSASIGKARDTERVSDIMWIKQKLDQFVGDFGTPPGIDAKGRRIPQDCKVTAALFTCFRKLNYEAKDPLTEFFFDPLSGRAIPSGSSTYKYKYGADQHSYSVCATLEDQGSRLLNADKGGALKDSTNLDFGKNDNMYCLRFAPVGATQVSAVAELNDPTP